MNITSSPPSANSALKAFIANTSIGQAYLAFEASRLPKIAAIRPAMAALGVTSSLLILITLTRNKNFAEPCFICYKAIASVSIVYSICEIISPMYRITDFYNLPLRTYFLTSYTWSWTRFVGNEALFAFAEDASICLVVLLALQRAVGCLLPIKFREIGDDRRIYVMATAFCVLFPLSYNLPAAFWEDVELQSGRYAFVRPQSADYQTYFKVKRVIRSLLIPAVFASSALAIIGLLKVFIKRYDLRFAA